MSLKIAHNLKDRWRSYDVKQQEETDFRTFLLSERVLLGLEKAGFKSPSPIQSQAIPVGRVGTDLIVQAKSGTGKTLVFAIIALESLIDNPDPQVLILTPVREIAYQICEVIKSVGSEFKSLKCMPFIGGIPIEKDYENLVCCQIVVGTPGRIKQLIQCKALSTGQIQMFVLDEVDKLLEPSFQADIEFILHYLPDKKQIISTSATYPISLKMLVSKYFQRNPYLARLNVNEHVLLGILHYVNIVKGHQMFLLAYRAKSQALENVLNSVNFLQCLVFCNAVSRVGMIYADILRMGFSAACISSEKDQAARLEAIDCLKRFKCKVLVTSDITSRGIDAESVNLIINFDTPRTAETYLHRIGRAGRFGSEGLAVSFITNDEMASFQCIQREEKFKAYFIPDPIPADLIKQKPDRKNELLVKQECSDEDSSLSDVVASNSRVITNDVNKVANHTNKKFGECRVQNTKSVSSKNNKKLTKVPLSAKSSSLNKESCFSLSSVTSDNSSSSSLDWCNLSFKQKKYQMAKSKSYYRPSNTTNCCCSCQFATFDCCSFHYNSQHCYKLGSSKKHEKKHHEKKHHLPSQHQCLSFNLPSSAFDQSSFHCNYQQQSHQMCNLQFNSTRSNHKNCFHSGSAQQNHQHNYNCYLPSQHYCHPLNPHSKCQSQFCANWYELFYRQWNFIQQFSNFA